MQTDSAKCRAENLKLKSQLAQSQESVTHMRDQAVIKEKEKEKLNAAIEEYRKGKAEEVDELAKLEGGIKQIKTDIEASAIKNEE